MVKLKDSKKSFFVYLGPSIRGVIQNGSLYEGNLADVEKRLSSQMAKYPRIKKFLLSGDTLATDRIALSKPGNYLSEEYRKFIAELKNKEV